MTKPAAKASRKNGKIRLKKATASELIAAFKFTPEEMRLARSFVAAAKRGSRRSGEPIKRSSSSRTTAK